MFPEKLDGAEVMLYTPKGDFGKLYYTTGEVFDYAKYLAICKYPDTSNEYYLFKVSESFEVISDYLCNSIDECVKITNSFYNGDVLWIRM